MQGVLNLVDSNILEWDKIKKVHLIGIGGSSMSGLAQILLNLGYTVSGSDLNDTEIVRSLQDMGIRINLFHSEINIRDCDLVVYTAAVRQDNPELIAARRMNIPVIERSVLLGELTKQFSCSIAVSGTHGKTTTTSMISMIMIEAKTDPSIHIGGILKEIGGSTRVGKSKYFITEACEYVESFLQLKPFLAVVLNIEEDHLDYYRDINHIKSSFSKFCRLVPDNGYVIACADNSNVMDVVKDLSCNVVTYGLNSPDAAWKAQNITFDANGNATYMLTFKGKNMGRIKLQVPGMHNVSNSLAAAAACHSIGVSISDIAKGLKKFGGANRRFELKGIVHDIKVIDDYAHHPTEIKATLKAARNTAASRVLCVFQPHTYSRTKALLDDFATAFSDADKVIITDIYAARETDPGDINSSMVAKKIAEQGKSCIYISQFADIVDYLKKEAAPGDIIITVGAGNVLKVGEMFLESCNKSV